MKSIVATLLLTTLLTGCASSGVPKRYTVAMVDDVRAHLPLVKSGVTSRNATLQILGLRSNFTGNVSGSATSMTEEYYLLPGHVIKLTFDSPCDADATYRRAVIEESDFARRILKSAENGVVYVTEQVECTVPSKAAPSASSDVR